MHCAPYPKFKIAVSKIQNCRIQNPKAVSKIQNCRIQNSKSPYPKSKSRIQNPKLPYPKISKIEDTVSKNIQKYLKPYSKFHRIENRIQKYVKYPKPCPKVENRIRKHRIQTNIIFDKRNTIVWKQLWDTLKTKPHDDFE